MRLLKYPIPHLGIGTGQPSAMISYATLPPIREQPQDFVSVNIQKTRRHRCLCGIEPI